MLVNGLAYHMLVSVCLRGNNLNVHFKSVKPVIKTRLAFKSMS